MRKWIALLSLLGIIVCFQPPEGKVAHECHQFDGADGVIIEEGFIKVVIKKPGSNDMYTVIGIGRTTGLTGIFKTGLEL